MSLLGEVRVVHTRGFSQTSSSSEEGRLLWVDVTLGLICDRRRSVILHDGPRTVSGSIVLRI